MQKDNARPMQDWYSISEETLRRWMIVGLVLAASVVGYAVWQRWEKHALERAAREVIEEARQLAQLVQKEPYQENFRSQFDDAWQTLQLAQQEFEQSQFEPALEKGRRSVALLTSITKALRDQGTPGEAHFISVAGRVEFRRGEHGDWEEARSRVSLRNGYYVKTSGKGSAEIMFADGTLYKVRPNTLFRVSRGRTATGSAGTQTVRMQYGWLDLSTARGVSRVSTPGAAAEVQQDSAAAITFIEDSDTGRFAAFRGEMVVDSDSGTRRNLSALQEVAQKGQTLSEPRSIPEAPTLVGPRDHLEVGIDPRREVVLSWNPVPGASRYELQVSRHQFFVDNVVESDDRRRAQATLGIRGEGTFLWRVRAINENGSPGDWSSVRRFRASEGGDEGEGDRDPPELSLLPVQTYGSILIVAGNTEPGAIVSVQGEPAQVSADGSFTKTVQVYQDGWSFLDVRSRDAYGNETVRPVRVYVDSL